MQAVILKKNLFSEGNEIITLYSRELGKVRGVARSVKSPKSKLAFALQDLFYVEAELAPSKGISVIKGAKPIEVFKNIRDDLLKVNYALYAAELILKCTADEQPNAALFDLFIFLLKHLDQDGLDGKMHCCADFFVFEALALCGYKIDPRICVSCQKNIEKSGFEENIFFSSSKGGFMCQQCASKFASVHKVRPETHSLFLKHYNGAFKEQDAACVALGNSQIYRDELHKLAMDFSSYILERDLKAGQFLSTIK